MKKFLLVLSVVAMASFLLVGCFQTANIAPVITTTSLPGGTVGTAYTATVNATDADGDTLTFSLSGMPTDMIIGPATGVISGWIPAAVGTVNVTVTVTDGTDPVSSAFTITVAAVPVPPPVDLTVVSIAVDDEYKEGAYTYVKGGEREITITFSRAIVNPGIDEPLPTAKVGGVTVPLNSADKKIWKGTGDFTGPCKDVLIEVGGVCDDVCAAITVTVDSVAPVISLEAEVEECDCDEGYQLVITSTGPYPECGEQTDCCGLDDCSGLKSVNVEIYTVDNEVTFPWELCCDLEDCAELIGSDVSCPISAVTECIPAVYTQSDEWVDFFDGIYYVKAVLEDNAGNVNTYYGEVTAIDEDTVIFKELFVNPITCVWCYAEAEADFDNIIGDCEQPPVECYVEPLEPCPVVTLDPAVPMVGEEVTITIDYDVLGLEAEKPTGVVNAYVGPAIKTFPVGIPEDAKKLLVTDNEDWTYTATYTFGQAGTDTLYVTDGCADCPVCEYEITVDPVSCPVPVISLSDNTPMVNQVIEITFSYVGSTTKPVAPAAYVGPAIKFLPYGIPEDAQQLALIDNGDDTYTAFYAFGQAGTDLIYVTDLSTDCLPYEFNVTVDPTVCPEINVLGEILYNGELIVAGGDQTIEVVFAVPTVGVRVFAKDENQPDDWDGGLPIPDDADEIAMTTTDNNITFTGVWDFDGDCDVEWIYVLYGDSCCPVVCIRTVIVDDSPPCLEFTALAEGCDISGPCPPCVTGERIIITNDPTLYPEEACIPVGPCCCDDCTEVAGWEMTMYCMNPFEDDECCETPDPEAICGEAFGYTCEVYFETDCLPEEVLPWGDDAAVEYWYVYFKVWDILDNDRELWGRLYKTAPDTVVFEQGEFVTDGTSCYFSMWHPPYPCVPNWLGWDAPCGCCPVCVK